MTSNNCAIINGPCKFDLMLSLFDGKSSPRKYVVFLVSEGESGSHPIEIAINQVAREDGSGESWCFKGYLKDGGKNVQGYFRTDIRRGQVNM